MVALMALSLSSTFVSCSDNDDDEPNFAKEIAGAYKGYSVGACNMFSDYLLGDESTATITANEDGTINLVYKSGSGDFTLNNLKLSSNKSFSGSGEVAMSMGGSTGGSYDYTSEGSVDGSKVLSLKANVDIPVPMGKMEIDFIQGETPVGYYIKDTYKYQTNLSLPVKSAVMSHGILPGLKTTVIVVVPSDLTVPLKLVPVIARISPVVFWVSASKLPILSE